MLYRHAPGPRLILLRVISTKCSLPTVIFHCLYLTQLSVVSGELVVAVVGKVAEDDLSGVSKVSLSPNVPSLPFKETKQEAG